MSCFSELAQEYIDFDYDRSYPSPEEQLLWRLDDLNNKREELMVSDAPCRNQTRLTDDDIRYAAPSYFENIGHVERAIQLAIEDLKNKYEIDILNETNDTALVSYEITAKQITMGDILLPQAIGCSLKSA